MLKAALTLTSDNCRTNQLLYSSMHAGLRKELEARHSLSNLSVHDLVEKFARHVSSQNRSSLYYSNSNSDTATRKTRIKACAQLIKRQRLELEAQLRKASKEEDLLDSNDYCSDSSLDINPKDDSEDEEATILTTIHPANKQTRIRDSLSARLIGVYILYFKELSSNNSRIFASVIGITRTQAIVLLAIIGHKNKVVAIDPANSILCNLSDLLVIRFCIFSNPALENIGIPTNKEIVEMQTNTATALANKLAAVNKLVRLQTFILKILEHANMPAMHPKAIKHRLALLAAQFALVRSFRKIDRHVFRANNTISQTIFDKFYNCKSEGIIIAKFYKDLRKYN
ncbi:hypothetical protein HBH44_091800 [Parastagonospora nodorum]|nr:hypothetical protein HBH44_091800 [Parastagonospora nodorum]KAH4580734.1 hypothetical protein HBH84_052270 [Parastagonospora nodorum]KAH4641073.1 hypothetical protein HBH55_029140 [Parastagonospora nodorum]